jgi:hypothetical protein
VRYFIDTEFIEDGETINLLSLAVVAEDGREFYRQNAQCDLERANSWVRENVIPYLDDPWGRRALRRPWAIPGFIRLELKEFLADDPTPPEFWGYYCAYDWVALCQLFGDMAALPDGWPMYCNDLRQELDGMGLGHIEQSPIAPHYALGDARWIKETYEEFIAPIRRPLPPQMATIRND